MVTFLAISAAILGLLGALLYFLFSGPNLGSREPGPQAKGTLEGFNQPISFRRLGLRLVMLSAVLAAWGLAAVILG